jgi:hypothetical protein
MDVAGVAHIPLWPVPGAAGIREMLRVRDVPAGWAAAAGRDGYLNG